MERPNSYGVTEDLSLSFLVAPLSAFEIYGYLAYAVSMELLRFNGAVERDPAIDACMKAHAGELGAIGRQWFEVMRKCGDEVRELLHDSCIKARVENG